jgi:hypothetical protein
VNETTRADRPALPTMRAMASSGVALNGAVKMVFCAAFTLLLLVCAVRTLAAGDWLSAGVATLLTAGLALATRRWFRRMRAAIAASRSPLE